MSQSLFTACKSVIRNGISGTQNVGGTDTFIEYYTQDDIDEDVRKIGLKEITDCTFGTSDESRVVLVASKSITIPESYTLTPAYPKKSLVIICNSFINNGTISMTAKAPNVLPHDWYIVGKTNGYSENVIIPAYANNSVESYTTNGEDGKTGISGANRQCGSGGTGGAYKWDPITNNRVGSSGSGYSFGGGAGSGGLAMYASMISSDVDSIYPMRGGNCSGGSSYTHAQGGVGNPVGTNAGNINIVQNVGCGGRIIIFCDSFENNGVISSNGTDALSFSGSSYANACGGASGAGAIDIFYNTAIALGSDNITAVGGSGNHPTSYGSGITSGSGGDGCITLSDGDQSPIWIMPDIFKPQEKYMSKDNMVYFLGELVKRMNGD